MRIALRVLKFVCFFVFFALAVQGLVLGKFYRMKIFTILLAFGLVSLYAMDRRNSEDA